MNSGTMLRCLSAVAIAMLAWAGCHSSKTAQGTPSDGALASVFITNSTRAAISDAIREVFRGKGFALMTTSYAEQVYDRKGTTTETLVHGGWFEAVWTRARVRLNAYDPGTHRLSCLAFRVDYHGDRSMEEEKPLGRRHAKEYRALLQQVKLRAEVSGAIR